MAVSVVGSTSTASVFNDNLTVTTPAYAAGDIFVVVQYFLTSYNNDITPPAGWTLSASHESTDDAGNGFKVWTKTATASEPADFTWVLDGSLIEMYGCVSLRDTDGFGDEEGANAFGNTWTSPDLTAADDDSMLLTAVFSITTTIGIDPTQTLIWDQPDGFGNSMVLAYDIVPAGSTGTRSGTCNNRWVVQAFVMEATGGGGGFVNSLFFGG